MSHRLRRGLVFAAFCLGLAAALPLLSRGDGPPLGDRYALLVGVRRYDRTELRDLPYAEADMVALADVLKKAGYKRVVLMTQTNGADEARFLPEAARIRTALKGLLADRTEGDSVLIAFAGHGVQYQGEDESYFCPMDAKLADKTTLVSLGEVYKELEKSEAGTRLLLADCCRNDPRSDEARAVDKVKLESVTRPQKALPPGGVAAFFSCSAGEKAFENTELKHGVFFHYVIAGLQGKADLDKDGQVDLDELVRYTKKQVPDFVRETYGDDVRQMPELIGKTRGLVALVAVGKQDEITNTVGMKLKLIEPGTFTMGSPKDEEGRYDDEGPQHKVEITKAFYMGANPVTKGQFAAFVKDDGYKTEAEKAGGKATWRDPNIGGYDQTDNDPVVEVTWNDAKAFCDWLRRKEKKPYELPTEAEWEYACRAGTTTAFSFPDPKDLGDYAWYRDNSDPHTHPVGGKKPNPWGLYDMHGNVWQWCADWYGPYAEADAVDPQGPAAGRNRILRGGSCYVAPRSCRSANRRVYDPAICYGDGGFRVVLRLPARTP